jgi:hypothetical protein
MPLESGDCSCQRCGRLNIDGSNTERIEYCAIQSRWQPAYSCVSEFEADIVERNLQQAGLKAKAAGAEALLQQLGPVGGADLSLPSSEETLR